MPHYPLTTHPKFKGIPGPVVLIIMDGIGIGKENDTNAVFLAKTPFLDSQKKSTLYRTLKAHGKAVGMPTDEDMGNSEVGHNALGAGRIFEQGASLVKKAIESEQLFKGKTWIKAIQHTQKNNSTLHLIGLLSDGNVHSHINHTKALIAEAVKNNISKIRLHILLDGRDVEEKSALNYINDLNTFTQDLHADIKIASGGGRMTTTMDRYNADWSMVEKGWNAHVLGIGDATFESAEEAISTLYKNDPTIIDQYLPSFVITKQNKPIGTIQDNDTVLFTNFRGDRAIEISMAFEQKKFDKFDRKRIPNIFYAGIMQYDGDLKIPSNFLVEPPEIEGCLSHYLCAQNVPSFAISETQKYGHVTYFWNGNKSGFINKNLETYVEIPSDIIPFDKAPQMKAVEITNKAIELLKSNHYKFGRINFPNGDMVGHTGIMDATTKSVEITDISVKRIVDTVNDLNGVTLVLADHGNADEMFTIKNGVKTNKTSHTLNPVPFAIIDKNPNKAYTLENLDEAGLANVAATICNLLGYQAPKHYEPSLIRFN